MRVRAFYLTLILIIGVTALTIQVSVWNAAVRSMCGSEDHEFSDRLPLSETLPHSSEDLATSLVEEQVTTTSPRPIKRTNIGAWREPLRPDATVPESTASCVQRGMQAKCLFSSFVVEKNNFFLVGSRARGYPNPIFPPDGQEGPLRQYHAYAGHAIRSVPPNATGCKWTVHRPAIFLFRMSGHSTYHLWENNLGPFFSTLQDDFNTNRSFAEALRARLNDRSQLLVVFVDQKPTAGPKAPVLLDELLSLFSDVALINATALERTCFAEAVVGISASSFPHRALVQRVLSAIGGPPSRNLPEAPAVLFISRNHPSVIRGRKIANEADAIAAANRTLINATGGRSVIRRVCMEDMSFRDQIALAARTNIIMSPHGGGVANCIWMPEGSVMLEFVAPIGKTLPKMYHTMCGRSGVTHIHFLADPDPADQGLDMKGNARLFSNMLLPPARLAENTEKALVMYRKNRDRLTKK